MKRPLYPKRAKKHLAIIGLVLGLLLMTTTPVLATGGSFTDLTPSPYYNPNALDIFATATDPDGFNLTNQSEFLIYFPKSYAPTIPGSISQRVFPTATITSPTQEQLLYSIPATKPFSSATSVEGLYKLGLYIVDAKGIKSGYFSYWNVNYVTGYPIASEQYPEPGTMVVKPTQPTINVTNNDKLAEVSYTADGLTAGPHTVTLNIKDKHGTYVNNDSKPMTWTFNLQYKNVHKPEFTGNGPDGSVFTQER